jgi:hypothetical protein
MQLCIPRIDTTFNRDYIFKTICRLKWGRIVKLYESRPKNNTNYRCVIIDINWNDKSNGDIKERLHDGNYINIVHDNNSPYFWRIMKSNHIASK